MERSRIIALNALLPLGLFYLSPRKWDRCRIVEDWHGKSALPSPSWSSLILMSHNRVEKRLILDICYAFGGARLGRVRAVSVGYTER